MTAAAEGFARATFAPWGLPEHLLQPGLIVKLTTALVALLAAACSKADTGAPDIRIDDAWARATVPGKKATAAYFTISNRGSADDVLISVSSSRASADVHSTSMDGGIMRMRKLDRLPLPANETVKLEPGGTHVMLTGLSEPALAGGQIDLILRFEKSQERKVAADVRDSSGEHK